MRSVLAALVLVLLAPATAHAGSGGALAPELSAPRFSAAPTTVAPGGTLTFALRLDGTRRRARVRIDLVPAGSRKALVRVRLGMRRTGVRIVRRWTPRPGALPEGRYVARLMAYAHGAHVAALAPLRVFVAPVQAAPTLAVAPVGGVFPVQGPYSFGGPGARFGAPRAGHFHQGQDIIAAAGTPVVTPVAGSVYWSGYQAAAAGYYVVVRGADGRDYVYMHLLEGSVIVQRGQALAAAQRLGSVGATGDADGPHLHFEIWPDGWWSSPASQPIDPLPQLEAWAT